MRSRRPFAIAVAATIALVVAAGAAGEIVGYSAAASPAVVQASTEATYTISLTNNAATSADRAAVTIAAGFSLVGPLPQATASCGATTWNVEVADGKITARRPGGQGGSANNLCPGGTLTITFSATAPAQEATYTWTTELYRGTEAFVLSGAQPTTRVDAGPDAQITSKPADPTNSRTATFTFTSDVPGATFQCALDGAAFAPCSSPQVYGGLGDGRHTFAVQAVGSGGAAGPVAAHAWTVDTRAPVVALSAAPRDPTNSTDATFAFAADEPATFACNVDGRGFQPCSAPAAYGGLANGAHTFAVRATDAAGNASVASRSWTVDTIAPQTALRSAPAARTSARTARFAFSATEQATFECKLDARPFAPCASPKAYGGLAAGRHTFAVRAVDAAGNVDGTPSLRAWTVTSVTRRAASSPLFAPAAGARVTAPPLLRWRAVPRARYYNVQLYRNGRKVLTTWPTRSSLRLRTEWRFNGRTQRLAPGVYRWYVWPGFGRPAARRYGGLLGTSTFVVGRAPARS